jgi:hypothetical protein
VAAEVVPEPGPDDREGAHFRAFREDRQAPPIVVEIPELHLPQRVFVA